MKDERDIIKEQIASCHPTDEPFYIVDMDKVVEQYNRWVEYLPDIQPYFAVKSNPDANIMRLLATLGCNFDCASKNEMANVLAIVENPDRIIFAIYTIYPEAQIVLRICVDDSNSKCKFNSKFGCPHHNILKIFEKVKELRMNLMGFSFHVGSGCSDPRSYYDAIEDCSIAYAVAQDYGFDIRIIDIGGGFSGIDKNMNIRFADICENIKKARADFFNDAMPRFISEPGRYFTEATHTLVMNVIAKKKEDVANAAVVIKYYLNDGIYGSFNCIGYDHQTPELIPLLPRDAEDKKYNSTFFGPTCDSLDCIYKDIPFHELNVGEWIYVRNFGSYTVSPSSSFNGFSVSNKKYIGIRDF